jgi:predicted type IV restriction endonuclease
MDFKDQIKLLGDRIAKLQDSVTTEEATKNAFIMPFIKELGYDVFNPFEVVPEFTADIGIKQGEKIDYAIMKNGEPIILIECKCHTNSLSVNNASQLFRYFHTTKAKFSILTNGIEFRFYTDLVETNKMDEKPFFVFNITDIKDAQIEELKKFHKTYFDFTNIVTTASELKYTNELKIMLHNELTAPSADFVRLFARKIHSGVVNQKVLDHFTELTKKSFSQYLNDIINDRLKLALTKETEIQKTEEVKEAALPLIKIETTAEEMEAFYIIRAILRSKVKVNRVKHRDAQSYFAILLDDNNRKTICRLYITDRKKQIGIFDNTKNENKFDLTTLDDIYNHSAVLIKALELYLTEPVV